MRLGSLQRRLCWHCRGLSRALRDRFGCCCRSWGRCSTRRGLRRSRWWWHGAVRRPILKNRSRLLLQLLWWKSWFRVFDNEHRGLNDMGLNCNRDESNFRHAILGRILRILVDDALALMRFCPVFLEQAIAYPFMSRSGERFGKNTATEDSCQYKSSCDSFPSSYAHLSPTD